MVQGSHPSYEEFARAVRSDFLERMSDYAARSDIEKFLSTEEARDAIQGNYSSCLEKFRAGIAPATAFIPGAVAGASNCLELLY